MKTPILLCLLAMMACTSCTKEYDCHCAGGITGGHSSDHVIKAAVTEKARTKCRDMGQPIGTPDGIYCDLR